MKRNIYHILCVHIDCYYMLCICTCVLLHLYACMLCIASAQHYLKFFSYDTYAHMIVHSSDKNIVYKPIAVHMHSQGSMQMHMQTSCHVLIVYTACV